MKAICAFGATLSIVAACTAFTEAKPSDNPTNDGGSLADDGGVTNDAATTTTTPPAGDLTFDGSLPLFEDPCEVMKPRCGGEVLTFHFDDELIPPGTDVKTGGGQVLITTPANGQKLCESNALHAEGHVENEMPSSAYLKQLLSGSFRGIYLRYAVRDVEVASGGSLKFGCGLWLSSEGAGTTTTEIRFKVSDPNKYELDGESTNGSDPSGVKLPPLPSGASTLIGAEIFAWLDTKANVIKLAGTYDGVFTLGPDLPYPERPTKAEIRCGVLLADNADGVYSVDIDNVSVELCP